MRQGQEVLARRFRRIIDHAYYKMLIIDTYTDIYTISQSTQNYAVLAVSIPFCQMPRKLTKSTIQRRP